MTTENAVLHRRETDFICVDERNILLRMLILGFGTRPVSASVYDFVHAKNCIERDVVMKETQRTIAERLNTIFYIIRMLSCCVIHSMAISLIVHADSKLHSSLGLRINLHCLSFSSLSSIHHQINPLLNFLSVE